MRSYAPRLLAVMVALTATAVLCVGDRAQVAARQAVVTYIYGDVQVRHGTGGWEAARLNEALQATDAVRTGAGARGEISLGTDGYVRISENSHLLITSLDSSGVTGFQAIVGGLWVNLEKALAGDSRFEVKMPTAIASVKGTVFRCEVDESGESSTYVYDGNVELDVGDSRSVVAPTEWARVTRDRRVALASIALESDDRSDWVQHCRRRDMLVHMGSPEVLVAFSDGGGIGEKSAVAASASLVQELQRRGFNTMPGPVAGRGDGAGERDGRMQPQLPPTAKYQISGTVKLTEVRAIGGGKHSARIGADVCLISTSEHEVLAKSTTNVRGEGDDAHQAVQAAVHILAERLAEELTPAMTQQLATHSPEIVRVEILGQFGREHVRQVRDRLEAVDGIARVTPLPNPQRKLVLLVAGSLQPEELAAILRQVPAVAGVHASARSLTVVLRTDALPAPPPQPSRQNPAERRGEPAHRAPEQRPVPRGVRPN